MTGSDCCFCAWGGDARYWTARAPLGPWHPGIAPQRPAAVCNLTGPWTCHASDLNGCEKGNLYIQQTGANFTYLDSQRQISGGRVYQDGYVMFPPAPGVPFGEVTDASGELAGCDRIRFYGGEALYWCRAGQPCAIPSYNDVPEINPCSNGQMPLEQRENPCSGVNFTIPAQQFNVVQVPSPNGAAPTVLYYGERSKSAPDGLKSHNFQAWAPLAFDSSTGAIVNLTFPATFMLDLAV